MLAHVMRLSVVFCWLASLFLGYQTLNAHNSYVPLPASSLVEVTAWAGQGSAAELRERVTGFAEAQEVTLAQQVPDRKLNRSVRLLYLIDGDPSVNGQRWLAEGMGDFGESMDTRVGPLVEAGSRTPIGRWVVFGSASKADAVQQFFESEGATTEVFTARASPPYLNYLPLSVQSTVWVIVLLLVGTTGAFVVSRTRRYAIERMHGARPVTLLCQDVASLALLWLFAGLGSLLACVIFTFIRYGGTGLGPFVIVSIGFSALFFSAMVISLGLVIVMVTAVDILGALKGKVASTSLTISAYVLRVAAVFVALGIGASTVALIADQVERNEADAALRNLDDASILTVGNAYTEEDENELGESVDAWLRGLDESGDLIVALQEDTTILNGDLAQHSLLIVNSAFLAEQPVELADGRFVHEAVPGQVTVAVPSQGWSERDALARDLAPQLEFRLGDGAQKKTTLLEAAPGQTLSTFIAPSDFRDQRRLTSVTDAVVVIVSEPLFGGYVSGASSGQILLTDPQGAISEIDQDPQLSRYVHSVTPSVDRANEIDAGKAAELSNSAFSTAVAYVVVIMSGVAATFIYTRKNAQRNFVRHIHGWTKKATYRSLLAVETVLLLLVLGIIPWTIYQERPGLAQRNDISPLAEGLSTLAAEDVIAMAALVVVTAGGFIATLLFAHRTLIHYGVSEA